MEIRFLCPSCERHKLGQAIYVWWEGRWGLGSRWVKVCVKCGAQSSVVLEFALDIYYYENRDFYRSIENPG